MDKVYRHIVGLALGVMLTAGAVHAAVIDFAGGTAHLNSGSDVLTTDTDLYNSMVDYYIEDGFRVDFVGGYGTIGNYYQWYTGEGVDNSVIHAHPFYSIDIVFTKVDGTAFDLNYVDMTSNTITGGGASSGEELSYITASNGSSLLLPSSDWGIEYLSNGVTPSDGIARLWLDDTFDGITSFTISSLNAYCFGMDNFYIDEPPPPVDPVPEPATMILLGSGLACLAGFRRKSRKG
ncbi:hypothetical protein JCM14469_30150 [Desulfatiferula olefinivorans]